MSKEYLRRQNIIHDKPSEIFGVAAVDGHIIAANSSAHITVSPVRLLAPDSSDVETRKAQVIHNAHPLGSHHVTSSGDGRRAASAGFGGEVKVWEQDERGRWGELSSWTAKFSPGQVWDISMSEDGKFLATSSFRGEIEVWNVETSGKVADYETKGQHGLCIDMSKDGVLTASGHQDGSVFVFNNDSRRLVHPLSTSVLPVRAIAFSPLGKLLAVGGDSKMIFIYDTSSGEQIALLTGHTSFITSLSWNGAGTSLLSVSLDGRAKIWQVEQRACTSTIKVTDKRLWAGKWLPITRGHEGIAIAGATNEVVIFEELV